VKMSESVEILIRVKDVLEYLERAELKTENAAVQNEQQKIASMLRDAGVRSTLYPNAPTFPKRFPLCIPR